MARMPKSRPSWLLWAVKAHSSGANVGRLSRHIHASWFHRYHVGSGRFPTGASPSRPGWAEGHSGCRLVGGLMTEHWANVMVRDQRNSPSLLVRPNVPQTALNHNPYATRGSRPASSEATAWRQPRRASRNSGTRMMSGSTVGRTRAERAI